MPPPDTERGRPQAQNERSVDTADEGATGSVFLFLAASAR
jgi:hypothetical protein